MRALTDGLDIWQENQSFVYYLARSALVSSLSCQAVRSPACQHLPSGSLPDSDDTEEFAGQCAAQFRTASLPSRKQPNKCSRVVGAHP